MGVSGCGKSEISKGISLLIGGCMIEGDTFHPVANIEKMTKGIPLNDDDRAGWLDKCGEELATAVARGEKPILACSALKKIYRDRLKKAVPDLGFIFLELPIEVVRQRCANRQGHFMPASLVDSQFATLEPPHGEPHTLILDATASIETLSKQAANWWKLDSPN